MNDKNLVFFVFIPLITFTLCYNVYYLQHEIINNSSSKVSNFFMWPFVEKRLSRLFCRMELRQKSKLEEVERRKVEDRRRRERENAAGLREAWGAGGGGKEEEIQVCRAICEYHCMVVYRKDQEINLG